jgi:hypothetical protein
MVNSDLLMKMEDLVAPSLAQGKQIHRSQLYLDFAREVDNASPRSKKHKKKRKQRGLEIHAGEHPIAELSVEEQE